MTSSNPLPQSLLVPQGAEYQAVRQGLKLQPSCPTLVQIPIGPQAVKKFLTQQALATNQSVLLMGLCGGLRSQLRVGDVVVYETCIMPNETGMLEKRTCDRLLTEWLQSRLPQAKIVTAYTSDRLIQTCVEKQNLAQYNSVDVVDMESFIILKHLQALGLRVAVLRVLSDDAQQTLPDLTPALSPEGNLKPFPLAIALLQHPVSAFQLIRSSLSGLQQLKQITAQLFSPLD